MALSNKALNDKIRARELQRIKEFFLGCDEDVQITGNGELCFPVVDEAGGEKWVQIVIKIPTGARDGEPFDGYSMAEDFKMAQEAKAAKAAEAARKKAEKIEKDKASRAAKTAAKEKSKKEKEEKA